MDRKLIDMINSGRCFALVGSGPSCEVGYPTWHSLAIYIYDYIKNNVSNYDADSYNKYISQNKYAEMFTTAEDDLGGREFLVNLIKEKFESSITTDGYIYKLISNWPFACYMTTNYDDEIDVNLKKINTLYKTIQNRREDFYHIKDGMKKIIQKLHSDLKNPHDAVITSRDYSRLYTDEAGEYFRIKLRQLFEMFNIVIIGHSLYDIDISNALQVAKNTASPHRPLYMFVSDVTKSEIKEYYDKYNITIIPYKKNGHKHDELIKILNMINNFIVPRDRTSLFIDETDIKKESDIASAIFLHRNSLNSILVNGIDSIILYSLYINEGKIKKENILTNENLNFPFSPTADISTAIEEGLSELERYDFIIIEDENIYITEKGREEIGGIQSQREKNKEAAYTDFINTIKYEIPSLSEKSQDFLATLAEKTITLLFEKRGLALANSIFSGTPVRPHELSSIFEYINNTAQTIEDIETRRSFINAMFKFSIEPTDAQKDYVASLSQGFFLYHAVGANPHFYTEVNTILKNNLWIYDSNILIPFIAIGCTGNLFADNFIELMRDNKSVTYTTYNIIREVFDHYEWCENFISINRQSSIAFLKAAILSPGYKQNLFIDGYINEYTSGSVSTFRDYTYKCFNTYAVTIDTIINLIKAKNIMPIDNYSAPLIGRVANLEDIKEIIRKEREKRGSYRSSKQVETDAELIAIINEFNSSNGIPFECDKKVDRIYVISQGKLFEHPNQNDFPKVWPPEQLYKFTLSISEKINNSASIWDGIISEYYNFGLPYINSKNYTKFFGQQIDQAKLSYETEKGKYIAEIDGERIEKLDTEFYKANELEKPLFVAHMGWKLAELKERQAALAQKNLASAENKVKALEAEKANAWKRKQKLQDIQREAEIRNAKNPRHAAKRRRQAKKRKKN